MATSTYDEALRRVLAHEGGYANHPSDPGGPTNYGITLADFRRYVKPDAGAQDVRAMSVAQAKAIYRSKYWNALKCDRLPAGVDYAVFDYGVNSGLGRAAKVLRALVGVGSAASHVDEATLARAAGRDPAVLIAALCDERMAFLKRLKTWPVFGKGWNRRVAEVRTAALAMAAAQAHAPPQTAPSRPVAGKAVVPVERSAQRGTTGAIVVSGGVAAERAHAAGMPVGLVIAIVLVMAAMAIAAWLFFRRRARRQQLEIVGVGLAAPTPAGIGPQPASEHQP